VHGTLLVDSSFTAIGKQTLAITGGTDAYAKARGQVTEPGKGLKLLDIQ
jgi:hypothetical protein